MNVKLGTYYDDFISNEVNSGRYNSKEDVVRKAILLLEEEENKMSTLRKELESGEIGQAIENFDPQFFLNEIHKKYL